MSLSKEEIGEIRHENQKTEHSVEKTGLEKPKNSKRFLIISIISIVFVLIVGGFGFSYLNSSKPGPLDDFTRCLTDKEAIMYGASFCKYSIAQKKMFGNSIKYLDVRDFSENPDVETTPTWLINGNYYKNVQTFDRLSSLTGCNVR